MDWHCGIWIRSDCGLRPHEDRDKGARGLQEFCSNKLSNGRNILGLSDEVRLEAGKDEFSQPRRQVFYKPVVVVGVQLHGVVRMVYSHSLIRKPLYLKFLIRPRYCSAAWWSMPGHVRHRRVVLHGCQRLVIFIVIFFLRTLVLYLRRQSDLSPHWQNSGGIISATYNAKLVRASRNCEQGVWTTYGRSSRLGVFQATLAQIHSASSCCIRISR
mmetsp:Transcript_47754/g.86004  ORF Transcript_47754/g.86004 Transcript_47754/m.86004 type:complete len:214 (-) Transcript_47754:375-1016(-)